MDVAPALDVAASPTSTVDALAARLSRVEVGATTGASFYVPFGFGDARPAPTLPSCAAPMFGSVPVFRDGLVDAFASIRGRACEWRDGRRAPATRAARARLWLSATTQGCARRQRGRVGPPQRGAGDARRSQRRDGDGALRGEQHAGWRGAGRRHHARDGVRSCRCARALGGDGPRWPPRCRPSRGTPSAWCRRSWRRWRAPTRRKTTTRSSCRSRCPPMTRAARRGTPNRPNPIALAQKARNSKRAVDFLVYLLDYLIETYVPLAKKLIDYMGKAYVGYWLGNPVESGVQSRIGQSGRSGSRRRMPRGTTWCGALHDVLMERILPRWRGAGIRQESGDR